jgi:hypothetical protein
MIVAIHVLTSVVCAGALLAQGQPPPKVTFSSPPPSEMVQIDGSKNPELIPQWNVWQFAFRVIATGSKTIPTDVLVQLSTDEADVLRTIAESDEKNDVECQARVLKLVPLLQTSDASTVNQRTREINLECRAFTLRARDRVLEALRLQGQTALAAWVESIKADMHVSVPKKELAFFRQPQ